MPSRADWGNSVPDEDSLMRFRCSCVKGDVRGETVLLDPGYTCWRTAQAERVAILRENGVYFSTVAQAIENARQSILLIGWQFDPRTRLEPEDGPPGPAGEIGHILRRLVREKPDLDVRLLLWRSPLPIALSQGLYPQRAEAWFRKRSVDFRLDTPGAVGACHHQKILVIDDRLAFCGGGDISTDRWDSAEHLDDDARRCTPGGLICPPRHEVMMMVDGPAARTLGDLARDRWARATGERLEPVEEASDPWPQTITPDLRDVTLGVARTEPSRRKRPGVRENEALHVESINQAKKLIYLENQYFTSPIIAAALARRLDEEDGPEIVIISTGASPSWFDKATMDGARAAILRRLRAADVYGKLSAWRPQTAAGRNIIVHSKVTIIDDRLIRVGSTNLNNRSCGFDTECDVAVELSDASALIRGQRQGLISHFLDVDQQAFADAEARTGSVAGAVEALNHGRLAPLTDKDPGWWGRFIAEYQLGDPSSPADAWRPWRRLRLSHMLKREIQAALAEATASTSKSITSGR